MTDSVRILRLLTQERLWHDPRWRAIGEGKVHSGVLLAAVVIGFLLTEPGPGVVNEPLVVAAEMIEGPKLDYVQAIEAGVIDAVNWSRGGS